MSAIAGLIHFNNQLILKNQVLNIMNNFRKYPADDTRTWVKDNVFLGCHAQWITPESINEVVPYYDYERKLAITADAIIDNRNELFAKLGIPQTEGKLISDSQLILLAYSKWKEELPRHLVGDFAFMIWDETEQKLFGARDFSGSRTLYFYNDLERVGFSTTMDPLFLLPFVKKEINEVWLGEFLSIPTMIEAVDMTSTVYTSIHQVPPSHSITVQDGNVALKKYDAIGEVEELKLNSPKDYTEAFHEVFERAVKERLRTFGSVGSQLSGGLDSGSVVSFAARELKKEDKVLHTFSYIPESTFEDWTPNYYMPNEEDLINETINHVGNIDSHFLQFAGRGPLSEVDQFVELMEMPYKFFENTYWLKGINEEAQKRGIKVLLNGARGNHSISWGSWNLNMEYYTSLLKGGKWKKLYRELDEFTQTYKTGKSNILPILARKAIPNPSKRPEPESLLSSLINPSLAEKTDIHNRLFDYNNSVYPESIKDLTKYRKDYFQKPYVWNKSGVAETNLSLRYGLWNRDPTNDINVIKFCLSLPHELYVRNGVDRSFIREATKSILPEKVRLNYHVRGLQGADTIHRMADSWREFLHEVDCICSNSELTGILNIKLIREARNRLGTIPRPEMVFEEDFKLLTRSLIVSRFIKSIERKEVMEF
ncbi:asparagine synthase-related protein [Halobacillus sp. B23F22_1]|uniref:asparagine synthase-related protein n=1 Tax=Halobacillus sp. B23F22_1 TaxID=3459514 RepID=UPI00373F12EF